MNDKSIVEEAAESFDVVVLQANLAASASKGLASWSRLDRPFWIDPVAYAFAASPAYLMSQPRSAEPSDANPRFKRTFVALAEAYGAPFDRVIAEGRSLVPDDFDSVSAEQVVGRVLGWQQHVLQTGSDAKYGLPETLEPVLLTVPYFPLQEFPPGWIEVNMRLIRAASEQYPPSRLAAGLLVEGDLFDSDEFLSVLDAYVYAPVEHIWLWLSDNDEVEMTVGRARALRDTVRRISASGKKVHIAFGGSYSTLMLRDGATSVGHGVGYWEKKNWEPLAGGGRPTLRYFFPPLRQRLAFLDADAVLDAEDVGDFHQAVCACSTCRAVLAGDLSNFARYGQVEVRTRVDRWGNRIEYDVPTAESLRFAKLHYLRAKGIEVARALNSGVDRVLDLAHDAERHSEQQVVSVQHLRRWSRALSD
jgi:hypothetical protein